MILQMIILFVLNLSRVILRLSFFYKNKINSLSKLLDCKVRSIGSDYVRDQIVIIAYIICKDLNDIRDYFK